MTVRALTAALCAVALLVGCEGGGAGGASSDLGPGEDARVVDDRGRPTDTAPSVDAGGVDARVQDAEPADAEVDLGPPLPNGLRINEVMAKNEGTWVDELGALEDWVEIYNGGDTTLTLGGWQLGDDADERFVIPAEPPVEIAPGRTVVLIADDTPAEGVLHLPFKLSAGGEGLWLWSPEGELVDHVDFPALEPNEAWARLPDARGDFARCDWATPGRRNGATCGPPPPPTLAVEETFEPYAWAVPWPAPPRPVLLAELALRPAPNETAFVELLNAGDAPVDLEGWTLRLAPTAPGRPWPGQADGDAVALDGAPLAAGERRAFSVPSAALQALRDAPEYEGVATLWPPESEQPVERVDFMAWPIGASLARDPDATGRPRYCASPTPGAANAPCTVVASRPIGNRLRHLRTPGDWSALAVGGTSVGVESVKWLVDLEGGGAVHLLENRAWDLHYTFVRELIEGLPHLDRCDPQDNAVFYDGWRRFSDLNYFQVESRRFLMGTLVHTAASDLWTLEFTPGDKISAAQMRRAFFAVMAHVDAPQRFSIRPTTAEQVPTLRTLEGQVPLVDQNAPFRGVTWQPLTQTTGYGVLEFVPADALEEAPLGPQSIVVTDRVPNDMPFVGGLVTEDFQTPLAHVNLLSRNRDTPNMALRDARNDPRIAPLLGRLVRLTVGAGAFEVVQVEPEEATAFWEARLPQGPPIRPRFDTSVRGVVDLADRGLEDVPSLGAKAAQFAELGRVASNAAACAGPVPRPPSAFAVPVVHGIEHFERSGAAELLTTLRQDPEFQAEPATRAAGLEQVRQRILRHPVDAALLAEVEAAVGARFASQGARFRSSSNTEDLPAFNGAGLYESLTGRANDPEAPIDDALRTVWASLWTPRAYDERAYAHVDQGAVVMGVLVHPAYPAERANGVAISRNVLEPLYRDPFINVQIGEASVTNPAQGVTSDQLVRHFQAQPPWSEYVARSSLTQGRDVMTEPEIQRLACVTRAIHEHFRARLDPDGENRWFAVDLEFKLLGARRDLLVKQARPYTFGSAEVPADCREF